MFAPAVERLREGAWTWQAPSLRTRSSRARWRGLRRRGGPLSRRGHGRVQDRVVRRRRQRHAGPALRAHVSGPRHRLRPGGHPGRPIPPPCWRPCAWPLGWRPRALTRTSGACLVFRSRYPSAPRPPRPLPPPGPVIKLTNVSREYPRARLRAPGRLLPHEEGRVRLPHRPLGLGQVHHPAAHPHGGSAHLRRSPGHRVLVGAAVGPRGLEGPAPGRLRVPGLPAPPGPHRPGERGVRAGGHREPPGRRSSPGPSDSCPRWGSPPSPARW